MKRITQEATWKFIRHARTKCNMFSRNEAQVPQEFVSAHLLCFKGSWMSFIEQLSQNMLSQGKRRCRDVVLLYKNSSI